MLAVLFPGTFSFSFSALLLYNGSFSLYLMMLLVLYLSFSCTEGESYQQESALPPVKHNDDALDHAIESGNWEAVAASAAALVGTQDM